MAYSIKRGGLYRQVCPMCGSADSLHRSAILKSIRAISFRMRFSHRQYRYTYNCRFRVMILDCVWWDESAAMAWISSKLDRRNVGFHFSRFKKVQHSNRHGSVWRPHKIQQNDLLEPSQPRGQPNAITPNGYQTIGVERELSAPCTSI